MSIGKRRGGIQQGASEKVLTEGDFDGDAGNEFPAESTGGAQEQAGSGARLRAAKLGAGRPVARGGCGAGPDGGGHLWDLPRVPRYRGAGPAAGGSAGSLLPGPLEQAGAGCFAARPRSGIEGSTQPAAASGTACGQLGDQLPFRAGWRGQRRLLRFDCIGWTASFSTGRCIRKGSGCFDGNGATARAVSQLEWDGPAAGRDSESRQPFLLREFARWAVRNAGVRTGQAKWRC